MKLKVRRGSAADTPRSRVIELGEWLLPRNGDIDEFVSAVADHRGRPGHVLSSPLNPAGPSGFWIGIPTRVPERSLSRAVTCGFMLVWSVWRV